MTSSQRSGKFSSAFSKIQLFTLVRVLTTRPPDCKVSHVITCVRGPESRYWGSGWDKHCKSPSNPSKQPVCNKEVLADENGVVFFYFFFSFSSSGWWVGLDPRFRPQELCHGFSARWESSICEIKLHYPGNLLPGPIPIQGDIATKIVFSFRGILSEWIWENCALWPNAIMPRDHYLTHKSLNCTAAPTQTDHQAIKGKTQTDHQPILGKSSPAWSPYLLA